MGSMSRVLWVVVVPKYKRKGVDSGNFGVRGGRGENTKYSTPP